MSSQNLLSSNERKRRDENIATDQLIADKILICKSRADNTIAENKLKIPLVIHLIIIFINIYLVGFSNQILKSKDSEKFIGIAIWKLTYFESSKEINSTSIFCYDWSSGNNTCTTNFPPLGNFNIDFDLTIDLKASAIIVNLKLF